MVRDPVKLAVSRKIIIALYKTYLLLLLLLKCILANKQQEQQTRNLFTQLRTIGYIFPVKNRTFRFCLFFFSS